MRNKDGKCNGRKDDMIEQKYRRTHTSESLKHTVKCSPTSTARESNYNSNVALPSLSSFNISTFDFVSRDCFCIHCVTNN